MQPNVILLVVDSLRYDAVFGTDAVETESLDRLAEEGIAFHHCFSQGISTAPSMTAMLTGRHPLDYGGHRFIDGDQPTFAGEFKENGYATVGIHSNPHLSRVRNYDKGFDRFNESILPVEPTGPLARVPHSMVLLANKAARLLRRTPYLPAEKVNDQIRSAFSSEPQPLFVWAQYMDVHGPYLPGGGASYRDKFRAERLWQKAAVKSPEKITDEEHDELLTNYRKEIGYVDEKIGELIQYLEEQSFLGDTIIVVVGDHGDEFKEHGQYGHGNLPYEELIHVPLIIRVPDQWREYQGEVVDEWNRCIDIMPTVFDLIQIGFSESMQERVEGESLVPVIKNGDQPSFQYVITEKEMLGRDDLRIALRDNRWKYIYDGLNENEHLYDLEEDTDEEFDVSDERQEVMSSFREAFEERISTIRRTSENIAVPEIEERPGVKDRLKALGYRTD